MTRKPVKDLAASIRQRLQNLGSLHQDFQYVLIRYASERMLYRLSRSPYRDRFVLKGAMLFVVWSGDRARPTRDVDLLGYGLPDSEKLRQTFREISTVECPEDGLSFDPDSVEAAEIREANEYGGIRVTVVARLGRSRVTVQVDVGFGDSIVPPVETVEYPALLDLPAPKLQIYPKEAVVAEKFHAMVNLGLLNSRMKDFYDLAALAREHAFDGRRLSGALKETFGRRNTPLPTDAPPALREEFTHDPAKRVQWNSFIRRRYIGGGDVTLVDAAAVIVDFLLPPCRVLAGGDPFSGTWSPGGPWGKGR
jgi:predicted nucleotidyltransferase component of viral defense system